MIELTNEQRQAMAQAGEAPTIVIDPQTKAEYVLLRADVYSWLRSSLEDDDARLMYPLLAGIDPEDWEDVSAYEGKQ